MGMVAYASTRHTVGCVKNLQKYVTIKHAKMLARIFVVVLFVFIVTTYDVTAPFRDTSAPKQSTVDCSQLSKDDPVFVQSCEDDTPLDLSLPAAIARYHAGNSYSLDLVYFLPLTEELNEQLSSVYGAATLVKDSPAGFGTTPNLYAYVPTNSIAWLRDWTFTDSTRMVIELYLQPSAADSEKTFAKWVEELNTDTVPQPNVDEYIGDYLATNTNRALDMKSVTRFYSPNAKVCTALTVLRVNNFTIALTSTQEVSCDDMQPVANIRAALIILNKIYSIK